MGLLDQASLGWKSLKEGKLWSRGIIPRMISAVLKKIECIEGQLVSSGGIWWKKIAEKRKERCKLHSMARAGNMKKTKSLTCLFTNRFQSHICQCDTKCKSRETHTNKSTHKRHKDTTSLRKGTTDDISTNKFTG